MNNAFLQDIELDQPSEITDSLQEKKVLLGRLIEAIEKLSRNEEWQTVKQLLFDRQIEKTEKQLLLEAKSHLLSEPVIYRLQGNLEWAKRFDLYKLAEAYKAEFNQITKKLNENAPF